MPIAVSTLKKQGVAPWSHWSCEWGARMRVLVWICGGSTRLLESGRLSARHFSPEQDLFERSWSLSAARFL